MKIESKTDIAIEHKLGHYPSFVQIFMLPYPATPTNDPKSIMMEAPSQCINYSVDDKYINLRNIMYVPGWFKISLIFIPTK